MKVGIVSNPFDPSTWIEHETDDLLSLLRAEFPTWPATGKIFDLEGFGDWSRAASITDPSILSRRDVTPKDQASAEALLDRKGPLLITLAPADPLTAILTVVAIAAGVAVAFLLVPKIPSAQRAPSPNNALAERTNQARPNARIPDIYGTVESTPDLLMQPYTVFQNNLEVEISFLCIGRGSYSVSRVRDGDTNIASITGASAAVYGPYTSPNSGDVPQLQIGPAIPEQVMSVIKLNEVNGQTLQPSNLNGIQGEDSIRFVYPDTIESNGTDIDFTEIFSPGDGVTILQASPDGTNAQTVTTTASARFLSSGAIEFETLDPASAFQIGQNLTVSNAFYAGDNDSGGVTSVTLNGTYPIINISGQIVTLDDPASINSDWTLLDQYPADRTEYRSVDFTVPAPGEGINLNGNYTLLAVSSTSMQLNNPALVNPAWNDLADLDGGATQYISPSISRNTDSWIGPFIVDLDQNQTILVNVVSQNGLYTLSKKKGKQAAMTVDFLLEATPVNSNDAAIGPSENFTAQIIGSNTERSSVGQSLFAEPSFSGRCAIRMRRTSPTPRDEDYSAIVDEVKWSQAYGMAPLDQTDFGDITTVMTRTVGTKGATSVKNRKLNARVTRRLPEWLGGQDFGDLVATDNVADIICAMALDPFVGRRTVQEVDFQNIYDTIAEVEAYFGTPLAAQFGYTFDDDDVSFEESVQTVAQAAFCQAFRQGRILRLAFDRAKVEPAMILNASNILPGSMQRTQRFGPLDDNDGVELDYTDPVDGAALTLTVPPEQLITSPRKVEVQGVRSDPLAYWHTWRAWNKLQYQSLAIELEAAQEASQLLPHDQVRIADRTRPGVLDGEVNAYDNLVAELSAPAPLASDQTWTMFIQHIDNTVEAIAVEQGMDEYQVVLAHAPRLPLAIGDDLQSGNAKYKIKADDDVSTSLFIASERAPKSDFTESVKAINYSFLYYQNDQITLWLAFFGANFFDAGPYQRDGSAQGGATTIFDSERNKTVYLSASGSGYVQLPSDTVSPQSYTKAAWIKKDDPYSTGNILSSHSAGNEVFWINGGNLLIGHAANYSALAYPWPTDGEWHHAAATYDDVSGVGALYLDGERVASGPVDARTGARLQAFGFGGGFGLVGRGDDLRLWNRALSPDELSEVYYGSKAN